MSTVDRKDDKESCWWNEAKQDGIQRKKLLTKKWDGVRREGDAMWGEEGGSEG